MASPTTDSQRNVKELKNYVGGKFVAGARTFDNVSPVDGTLLSKVHEADQKLVDFRDNPHHRRAKLVVLSPAGADAVAGAEQAVAPIDRAIAEGIGAVRIRDAIATLHAMVALISERLDQPPSPLPSDEKDA